RVGNAGRHQSAPDSVPLRSWSDSRALAPAYVAAQAGKQRLTATLADRLSGPQRRAHMDLAQFEVSTRQWDRAAPAHVHAANVWFEHDCVDHCRAQDRATPEVEKDRHGQCGHAPFDDWFVGHMHAANVLTPAKMGELLVAWCGLKVAVV